MDRRPPARDARRPGLSGHACYTPRAFTPGRRLGRPGAEGPPVNVLPRLLSKSILLAGLLAFAAAPAFAQKMPKPPQREGVRTGDLAYDFTLKDLAGNDVQLSALRGDRVVLVVFWATWCMPCIQEMPELVKTWEAYHDQGLEILGVVVTDNQTKEDVQEFVTKRKVPYPILWDEDSKVSSRWRVYAIPQNFLIGRDGIIRYAGGVLPEQPGDLIRTLLGAAPVAPAAALR